MAVHPVAVLAPPTVANVGPVFDRAGIAIGNEMVGGGLGDIVQAELTSKVEGVRLVDIVNKEGNPELPSGSQNVVEAVGNRIYLAYKEIKEERGIGIQLRLFKRLGVGTGMGSSASSSVAAGEAVDNLLGMLEGKEGGFFGKGSKEMVEAIVYGEYVACGAYHADNVLPSHLGGAVFIHDTKNNYRYLKFPMRDSIWFAVVHPDLRLDTSVARAALKEAPYNIPELVRMTGMVIESWNQGKPYELTEADVNGILKENGSAETVCKYLAGTVEVLFGIASGDAEVLGRGVMKDGIITPVRAGLIDRYYSARDAGLDAGALGASLAGSGPSLFLVTETKELAQITGEAVKKRWYDSKIKSEVFVSPANNKGAIILS